MKVAHVTDTYKPQINGVVSSVCTIKKALEEKGHKVDILAPTGGDDVYKFQSLPFHLHKGYHIALARTGKIKRIFRKINPEIVHVHTPFSLGVYSLKAARQLKIPVVGTFHTMISEYTHYISDHFGKVLRRLSWKYIVEFYERFGAVTTPSVPIKKKLVRRGLEDVYVLPNCVDLNLFSVKEDTFKRNSAKETPTVLFVGRLGKEKRLEILINSASRILREYPNTVFEIVGDGANRQNYEALVGQNGLSDSFFFRGYLKFSKLLDLYKNADIFVIPSDTETQGLVVLEAMACGTPVVGADALGLKYTITHGKDGYLFSPNSLEDLSSYIMELLEDEKLRQDMGKNARKKAEKFSAEKIGQKWLDFYSSFL